MKILVLSGSPKRDRSDTMHITRAFISGMNDVGQNVLRVIHAIDEHIEYCTGCLACMRNGGFCAHDDDMRGILDEMLDSDLIIFSFPLYCYGMPAPLKALVDRTLPLMSIAMKKVGDRYVHPSQRDVSRLRFVMICGCGFPNSANNFEPAVLQFRMMFHENATIITVPEAPMFNVPEAEAVTRPYLETVRAAGREYAKCGAVTDGTMALLGVPMIPEDEYARICSGEADENG